MTTIFYQFIIYYYVSLTKEEDPDDDKVFTLSNLAANIIVYSINLNLIFYLLYVYKTSRVIKFSFWIALDLIMFLSVLCNLTEFPSSYFKNSDKDIYNLIKASNYSVIIICAWLRVISILMTTRSFGPVLRIIYNLIEKVFNFCVIFFGLITVFAQAFTLIFKETNDDFKSFFNSWVSLYQAAFGIVEFQHFTSMKLFGYIVLMLYVTITNIMLLNLVIAIVNNLYSTNKKKADAENRAVLVLTYERIKWHEEYGLLILLPAPFNLISLFFIIILLFIVPETKREYYNTKFSKIAYFVILLGNFSFLILCSLFFLPIAYVKSLIHLLYDNHHQLTICHIYLLPLVMVKQLLVLLKYIVEDCINFWKICYIYHTDLENDKNISFADKDMIYNIRNVLIDFKYFQKKKIVPLEEIFKHLGIHESNTSIAEKKNQLDTKNNSINTNNPVSNSMSAEKNKSYRILLDKFVDKDRLIDVDRTLILLPARVKYTSHFMETLHYSNMRVILRGLRKFYFMSSVNNPIYSFKKLQQIYNKIMIKLRFIYRYIPNSADEFINQRLNEINQMEKYHKSFTNLRRMEEDDELSDYDGDEVGRAPPADLGNISNNN